MTRKRAPKRVANIKKTKDKLKICDKKQFQLKAGKTFCKSFSFLSLLN